MRAASTTIAVFAALLSLSAPHPAAADPCGMVPPVVQGLQDPIVRVGPQRTYVFYRKGIETFVIRPGFRGKVEEFGMLIPFPTPPAIRKVPDNIFAHIASAIDPPEVQVWVRGYRGLLADSVKSAAEKAPSGGAGLQLARNQVRVLRREAVGMYEVAVLAAGSAQALSRWMDQHKFKYPKGMDQPVNDYVKAGWCFVAVKTRVGAKGKVNPRPGMRNARTSLPPSGFTGHVQGMGFRFKTDGLVVPMRLSAFNKGRLRNVVYILSTGPKRIKKIPQKYVMRQLPGWKLYRNLTRPLPLRVFGGTFKELNKWQRQSLGRRRNPVPHNGLAAELFASDLLAARSGRLSHPFEEREKSLLNIGEELGLRGAAIDALNAQVLGKARKKAVNRALRFVKQMSLSVVDGDFARDVLSQDNLRFAWFRMPRERNNPASYNARTLGPDRSRRGGTLYRGSLDSIIDKMRQRAEAPRQRPAGGGGGILLGLGLGVLVAGLFALALVRRRGLLSIAIAAALLLPADAHADPCGMVPPVVPGVQDPIERVGAQTTYVFYKRGMETFVIRPGFRGKAEEFGMLIPFPTPPAIRKVPDKIFSHIAAAIDPPEVVVWAAMGIGTLGTIGKGGGGGVGAGYGRGLAKDETVRVLRKEAVGMYEVAVLAAGSAKALERWMTQHKYKYPKGMDQPVTDYVKAGWCFVAVKTRVGPKAPVNPRPGMRKAKTGLPPGGSWDGHVQGMGFRFKTDGLVVPMRLSAFNKGRLRNIVYVLAEGPRRIKQIPPKYVMRQLPGWKLYRNVTRPLPLRVIGGTFSQVGISQRRHLPKRRDPRPHNGQAAELFASDILAARLRRLAHPFEEREKTLLDIGERLGLRGANIDALNAKTLAKARQRAIRAALPYVKRMTLSVVDGDFARDVVAKQNLQFAWFRMPAARNDATHYNARTRGPSPGRPNGILYRGSLELLQRQQLQRRRAGLRRRASALRKAGIAGGAGAICTLALLLFITRRRRTGEPR